MFISSLALSWKNLVALDIKFLDLDIYFITDSLNNDIWDVSLDILTVNLSLSFIDITDI